jgi:hypothetical protein
MSTEIDENLENDENKIFIGVAGKAKADLEDLAVKLGLPPTRTLMKTVALFRFLLENAEKGGRTLVQHPDKTVSEMFLKEDQ